MSAIAGIVLKAAVDVGAPIIGSILGDRFGKVGGALAETVIRTVAEKAGVEPEALPSMPEWQLQEAVLRAEKMAPELVAVYAAGVERQFDLLSAETKEGYWQSFWRYGWMYLLAAFWVWRIVVGPIVNQRLESVGGVPVDLVELGVLMTLTSWFMALYMGGHTVKDLGKNVLDAVIKRGSA